MTITVHKLLSDLLAATYTTKINVTLRTPDGESFDFSVTDTGYDSVVDTFDLFVDMPADAPIKHPCTHPTGYVDGAFVRCCACDFRLTQLTDVRSPDAATTVPRKVWSSGWNIPGYLPDDEPRNFDSWNDAWGALVEALRQAIADEANTLAETQIYQDALDDLCAAPFGTQWCRRVGNYVWWLQDVVLPEES